jgi:hypothetical protein
MRWAKEKTNLISQKSTKMYKLLISFLLVFFSLTAYPTPKPDRAAVAHHILRTDTGKLVVRSFDLEKLKDYREQSAFQYAEDAPDNAWERFWNWIWMLLNLLFSNQGSGAIIRYVVIGIFAAGIIYIIIKAVGLDMGIITGRSKALNIPYTESLENIHEINFHEEIQQAITNGNFRLAVRLNYLSTLKRLNDQRLINWQPEKTNQTYVNEITDLVMKQQFLQLTAQFEYIWYGEFFINRESFSTINSNFDQFNSAKR